MGMTLSSEEKEYIKWAINKGVKTAEMAYIIMTHRTRTLSTTFYSEANHMLSDTQNEFTNVKIEINKMLARL